MSDQQQFYDCKICNIHGLSYSSQNIRNHFQSTSHKHMKMFYDNGLWPCSDGDKGNSSGVKIFKFLDFKGTIMCDLCKQIVLDGSALLKHQHQPEHLKRLIEGRLQDSIPVIFACDTCDVALRGHNAYFQHNSSQEHLSKVNAQKYDGCVVYSSTAGGDTGSLSSAVADYLASSKHVAETSSASTRVVPKKVDRRQIPVLNLKDPFVGELLSNLSTNLKNMTENSEKTDLLVAGLIKSETDFSGADRLANLRQILLRKIALECKNRRQTRRVVEAVVYKHVTSLTQGNVDDGVATVLPSLQKKKARSSSRTKSRGSRRSRSRSRSRSPSKSKRSRIRNRRSPSPRYRRRENEVAVARRSDDSFVDRRNYYRDLDAVKNHTNEEPALVEKQTAGVVAMTGSEDFRAPPGCEIPDPSLKIGKIRRRGRKKKKAPVEQPAAVVAADDSAEPIDPAPKLSGVVVETPANSSNSGSNNQQTSAVEATAALHLDNMSLIEKIEYFYSKSVAENFFDLLRNFQVEIRKKAANVGVWDAVAVELRDAYRRKLYEQLKNAFSIGLSKVQMEALLIMFDMKLDIHVRRRARNEEDTDSGADVPLPQPGEVIYPLTSPKGEVWNFEPPPLHYRMMHAIRQTLSKEKGEESVVVNIE